MVAQQANIGRLCQEQLEHAVAMRTPRSASPDRDLVLYLRVQLAHRNAQLEHVRSQRDSYLSKKHFLTQMRLLSSDAKH